jgi:glycosyltransferase 2 family protein
MKLRLLCIVAAGLLLALYFITTIGFSAVVSAALTVGWGGFALLCLYSLGLFIVLGAACGVLLPKLSLAGITLFVWSRMVRDAATETLPFSALGGLVLGVRAAMRRGVSRSVVLAATVVDMSAELLTQVGYIALGLGIFMAGGLRPALPQSVTLMLVIGLLLTLAVGATLCASQRYRHGISAHMTQRFFSGADAASAGFGAALDAIYRLPARLGLCVVLHGIGWLASAISVWVAFHLMGSRIGIAPVIAMESLVSAARIAAFLVPNALGVQEGTYVLLAPLVGVGPEMGLAVSLLKRARDLAVGVPILLIWQAHESQRVLRRTPPESAVP